MGLLVSQPMGKKGEFIRIRADADLKQALAASAKLHIRQEADEARYLLMKSLGMIREDIEPYRKLEPQKTKTPDHG